MLSMIDAEAKKSRKILINTLDLDERTRLQHVVKLQTFDKLLRQIYKEAEDKYPTAISMILTGQSED